MSEPHEDRELNEYLEGRSPLSARYRAASGEEPSAAVDDAILAASRRAVRSRPVGAPIPRRWVKPLSLAAIVVLSVTVVITMQRDSEVMMLERDAAVKSSATTQQAEDRKAAPPFQMSPEAAMPPAAPASGAALDAIRPEAAMFATEPAPVVQGQTAKPLADIPASPAARPRAAEMDDGAPKRMKEEAAEVEEARPRRIRPPAAAMDIGPPAGMEEDAPAALRRAPSAMIRAAPPDMPPLEDTLVGIVQLWETGNREAALEKLRAFLFDSPDYPDGDLQRVLPPELYAEARRFREE